MLLTSNESVLLHFVPRIHLMPPYYAVPEQDVSVVLNGFTAIGDVSNSSWVVDTRDCTARFLLDQGDPMYEEGSENLPLSQYYAAALPLSGFNFISVAYMPDASTMYQRQVVCAALQPPVPPPERPESVFDIDVPGLGRTVESGAVWVPSMVNGTGGFLHTGGLEEYVMCYVGDDDDASPIFNSIGAPFAVVDVLPIEYFLVPISPRSSSLQSYVNITSRLLGVVRCLALLSDAEPPLRPEDIFYPDTSAIYYLGSSDPVQFDQGGTSQVIAIYFDQIQAKFIAPSPSSRGQPEMRVWCAHEGSTIFYPYTSEGYALRVQARQPPSFFYKQLNATITSIALTLDLDLTDIVAEWENGIEFPANQYDAVEFSSKPLMPEGLEVNPTTGAIFGSPRPAEAGVFLMTIVATSINPPRESSETQLEIQVDDVLGLEWRSANVDSVVVTISPRSTAIYQVEEVFLLTQKGTKAFTGEPSEFFCTGALATQPFVNESKVFCSVQNEACCCAGFLLLHLVKQDIRILTRDCELEPRTKFHTAGVVVGFLTVTPGVPPARYGLRSSFVAEFSVPEEVPASEKYPVTFDLFIGGSSATDYNANPADYKGQLILELNAVVNIPKELVSIVDAREQDGGVIFDISFDVETRCLEQVGMEVRMLSFGIDVQEGCNLVAPKEYMAELDGQLRAEGSALFYRTDLELVKFADPDKSFSYALAMHFCTKEPFWKYGAVVESEDQCPLDMTKVGAMGFISITLVLSLLASIACYFSSEFASVSFLYQTKVLDVLTPLLALYTVGIDYLWLALLNAASVHVMLDALFMASMCHLFLCFCVNVVSMRIIITSYILDTPWWRRNKKRLRLVLFLSTVSPRFFRITRSHIFGFDSTHIHFGTPSKMSVVFANMSSLCVLQDVPQILLQAYVWVVWRNQGPQIAYICFFLHGLSILTAILHHVFSRSQRAAYERVVKLLGVRRLTAGFWDVTTAVAQPNEQGKQKADKKKMLTDDEAFDLGPQSLDDITDPSKLDPIQAAMYVSAMWDKEAKGANQVQGDDDELGSDVDEDPDVAEAAEAADKTLYPQALHDKLRKFYMLHDPAKVDTIGVGNVQVDEAEVDAMLKRFYNQGLDSVE